MAESSDCRLLSVSLTEIKRSWFSAKLPARPLTADYGCRRCIELYCLRGTTRDLKGRPEIKHKELRSFVFPKLKTDNFQFHEKSIFSDGPLGFQIVYLTLNVGDIYNARRITELLSLSERFTALNEHSTATQELKPKTDNTLKEMLTSYLTLIYFHSN